MPLQYGHRARMIEAEAALRACGIEQHAIAAAHSKTWKNRSREAIVLLAWKVSSISSHEIDSSGRDALQALAGVGSSVISANICEPKAQKAAINGSDGGIPGPSCKASVKRGLTVNLYMRCRSVLGVNQDTCSVSSIQPCVVCKRMNGQLLSVLLSGDSQKR